VLVASSLLVPATAAAWWNGDWSQRTRITLNTSAQGLETKEGLNGVPIAVRLHSGNFDFSKAKPDGSDLRVVASDDKTPLKFAIERFDDLNEIAVLWVQVPVIAPASDKNTFYVYAGNPKAAADPASASGFDAATLAAVHFGDAERRAASSTSDWKAADSVGIEANGLLGASLKLDGTPVSWPASEVVRIAAGGAATLSMWIKPNDVTGGTLVQWGQLSMGLQAGRLVARIGKVELAGGEVRPAAWNSVVLTIGAGKAVIYLNGASVAQADVSTPELSGPLEVGRDITGVVDELEIANAARSADWVRIALGAQGAEGRLVSSANEAAGTSEGPGHSYFGILIKNLTTDAWVVIIILAVMFVVAAWVMVSKAILVARTDRENQNFLKRFRAARDDLLHLSASGKHPNASLFRLYESGVQELRKRKVGTPDAPPLSGLSLDAVKATVDADLVRESQKLNSNIVLLTIAISGGPFLGLLGTVVGVMITFAAIAAAGDVNVTAIAPGIAAALLATVAGLGVAIPALFGYNYLASRIKNISTDMQIFVDEFISRVAESYGAH
jgi:biopolymer transport protein ExbB